MRLVGLIGVVEVLWLVGCSPLGESKAGEARRDSTVALQNAPSLGAGQLHVRRWKVTTRLDPGRIGTFARLSPDQIRQMAHLLRKSVLSTSVEAWGGRLLIHLSRHHPAGPADLLLAEDLDRLQVFVPDGKRSFAMPLERLPDILDGHVSSERGSFVVALEQDPKSAPLDDGSPKSRPMEAAISYRYAPTPGRPVGWPIQHRFRWAVVEAPREFYAVFQQPLLHLALPQLQGYRGRLALEGLSWFSGPPLAWQSTIANEGKPGGVSPTFISQVHPQGHIRVPAQRMEANRKGYRPGRTQLPSPRRPGAQRIPPAQLAGLRAGRPGALTINNRATYSAMIHLDGALLGWVAARRKFTFQGLPAGYYRIYAVSPTGIRSWGPFDMYVPGPLTLR